MRKKITFKQKLHLFKKYIQKQNKGQTIIEFIFLLSMITFLSFSFMKISNSGIARVWRSMVEIITENSAPL